MFARTTAFALTLVIAAPALAQEWPAGKPVHILVGFGAGLAWGGVLLEL